jgi:hypothetical protein
MPDQPAGIELKLENGMVIKGENAEEALKSAAKIIEDNVKSYRETKAQLDQLNSQFQEFQSRAAQPPPPPIQPGGFDKDRYYKLLNEDPVTANDYWFEHRTGRKIEEVMGDFQGIQAKVDEFRGSMLAATFTNTHPDFPSDTESAQKLTSRIKELQQMGHPTDVHSMDLAYTQLINEGKLKPMVQEEIQEELPPSLGGAGSVMSDAEMRKAEQLSDKELAALLKSKGML